MARPEAARSVLREWQAEVQKLTICFNGFGFDYRQQIPAMDLMVPESALRTRRAPCSKAAKGNQQWEERDNLCAWQKFAEFENRLALLGGDGGRARVTALDRPPFGERRAHGRFAGRSWQALKARRNYSPSPRPFRERRRTYRARWALRRGDFFTGRPRHPCKIWPPSRRRKR